jgi:hypothetical protein
MTPDMPTLSQQKQQQDLVIRLEQLKSLFTHIQQEIEQLSSSSYLAPFSIDSVARPDNDTVGESMWGVSHRPQPPIVARKFDSR